MRHHCHLKYTKTFRISAGLVVSYVPEINVDIGRRLIQFTQKQYYFENDDTK